jgi:hypothetical protein
MKLLRNIWEKIPDEDTYKGTTLNQTEIGHVLRCAEEESQ